MDKEYLNKLMRCDYLKSQIEKLEPGNAKTIINIAENECLDEESFLGEIYEKLLQGVDYSGVKNMEDIQVTNSRADMRRWLGL